MAHGGGHQLGAAKLEEAAMADLLPRRPVEHAHRVAVAEELAQRLARLVPIDEKDERAPIASRNASRRCVALGLVVAGDEVEGLALGEPLRRLRVQPAPASPERRRTD